MHVSDDWLKERTGKHRSTIARWRAAHRFPPELERLAELELFGRLELISEAWRGWTIDARTGELVAPGGLTFRPGELLAIPVRQQLLRELERAVAAGARPARRAPLLQGLWGRLRATRKRSRADTPRG